MLFHVQYEREGRWEAFGSGEAGPRGGSGAALADLLTLSGGSLPAGRYRCIPATSARARWELFDLEEDGRIVGLAGSGHADADADRVSC